MAHFARLDSNNMVTQVIVVSDKELEVDGVSGEQEDAGIAFCQAHVFDNESVWKQTSYNSNGWGFRGNYAGIGMTYMEGVKTLGVASTDIFIEPQPYPSWSLGITTAMWYPPDPPGERPELTDEESLASKTYYWDEAGYQADTSNPKTVGWALTVHN